MSKISVCGSVQLGDIIYNVQNKLGEVGYACEDLRHCPSRMLQESSATAIMSVGVLLYYS